VTLRGALSGFIVGSSACLSTAVPPQQWPVLNFVVARFDQEKL
jgi:hypothetical protein